MLKTMAVRATIAAILVGFSMSAPAIADSPKRVDIPAGDLRQALLQIAEQFGTDLVYSPEQIQGIQTRGAHGPLTTEQAVTRLLEGTSLELRTDPSGAMLIAPPAAAKDAGDSPESQKKVELEEVVVTGSHIRGSEAAGSKVIVIDRKMIDASGYGRVQDVLATLTQNFQGVSETYSQTVANNFNRGAEIQLRGLGPGTTLTLVNGQRQAVGGPRGSFVDISNIAASAIERIEILPEGASALYGSDAIGGVVNIILRKDFDGLETRVRGSSAGGEADEVQLAQLWGTAWSSGYVLAGYQYSERDPLFGSQRAYSAANDDLRQFGGRDLRTSGSNPGTILNPATQQPTHAIPPGQDGTDLTRDELIAGASNYTDYASYTAILSKEKMHGAFLSASYDLADAWSMFLDGRYGTRDAEITTPQFPTTLTVPATNAFNRMGGPVLLAYQFTRDLGPLVNFGTTETAFIASHVVGALPAQWQLKIGGSYAKERNRYLVTNGVDSTALTQALRDANPATALNVFGDGSHTNPATLAALRRPDLVEQGVWTTTSGNFTVDGPLFDLPTGAIRLAIGGDYRKEHLSRITTGGARPNIGRNVSAAFGELAVPVLGPQSPAGRVDVSLAGRYERYDDFGSTFDPKVGLSWQPWEFLKVRGTWGTSFRAPPFYLSSSQFLSTSASARFVQDPRSTAANGQSQILVMTGVHPDIREETADVWTAGVDLKLPAVEGLSLSTTLFDIHYQGRIQNPGSFSTFLLQESQYAAVITRDPTPAQIDAICRSQGFIGGACSGSFAAILDGRVRNLSSVRTRGLDAELAYSLAATSLGTWGAGVRGTYTFDYESQLTDTAPVFDIVDTVNNPLALRLAGYVSWGRKGWTSRATVNHAGSYQDPTSPLLRTVDSWTTLDLNAGYEIDSSRGFIHKTQLNLGVVNALDKEPPLVDRASVNGYDGANANLLGRQVSLQVVMRW